MEEITEGVFGFVSIALGIFIWIRCLPKKTNKYPPYACEMAILFGNVFFMTGLYLAVKSGCIHLGTNASTYLMSAIVISSGILTYLVNVCAHLQKPNSSKDGIVGGS